MITKPILLDIPVPIITSRLLIRPPQAGDGIVVNDAILESFKELKEWMPWAQVRPKVDETEEFMRQAAAKWMLREDLVLFIFDKNTGEFLGGTGFHRIDWKIPRFEIGYWLRTSKVGQGIISEATSSLTEFAFDKLYAKRVEIRCDEANLRSCHVAKRAGYKLDAVLHMNEVRPDGSVRNTCVYSKTIS